jgi:hypothetical protein
VLDKSICAFLDKISKYQDSKKQAIFKFELKKLQTKYNQLEFNDSVIGIFLRIVLCKLSFFANSV